MRSTQRWQRLLPELLALGLVLCGLVGSLGVEGVTAETLLVPPVQLALKGTLLSARLDQVPLKIVLTELAQQADLMVYITEEDAQKVVSATFSDLPLQEGIARILQGKSYALITEPTVVEAGKPPGKRVAKIRVLSQGGTYTTLTGRPVAPPVASAPSAPSDDIDLARWKIEAVEAPEAEKRIAALQALDKPRYLKGGALQPVVEAALRDAAPEVRALALEMLPGTMPESEALLPRLGAVAQQDVSPALRMQALMTLVETRDAAATGYIQHALQDPDPEVRTTAQELLEMVAARAGKAPAQSGQAASQ